MGRRHPSSTRTDTRFPTTALFRSPRAELVVACCDSVLVGGSLGMVLHGRESTLGVTLEMMILHGKAVRRGLERALMVVDLPFGTYEESPQQALRTSARVMAETGCAAEIGRASWRERVCQYV